MKTTIEKKDGYCLIHTINDIELGFSEQSGIKIIEVDGLPFKDLERVGKLLPYEDWRLPAAVRAKDLASRMTIDEIAGLMLYSPQNWLPMPNDTYDGKPFTQSGKKAWDLSDSQLNFLINDNVRHVLVSKIANPETAARWNNNVQALVEGRMHGIPANNSSDPRHSATFDAEFAAGSGGQISLWSNPLGLAATFDTRECERFGKIASREYRLLGLTTALSPQADIGSDPRWYRFSSTFGSCPKLVTDFTRAYAEAFQTSVDYGWGKSSVNTMVKHWPGGGSGEGGRDAHYGNGKYAVYPGGCFNQHKIPFLEGAFKLNGGTEKSSAVMPYYTISYNQTQENVGNGFNHELITNQLRKDADYDGVVCTDWLITHDEIHPGIHSGKPWGMELATEAQRHYKALMAGVDQFGGNDKKDPIIEAYKMGVKEHGEVWMRKRMEKSAQRLLLNIFRTGLFENPYVDSALSAKEVGCSAYMEAGFQQQLKSIVMLKNRNNVLPLKKGINVYIPKRTSPAGPNYWRQMMAARIYSPIDDNTLSKYFHKVDTAQHADVAIVFIESPHSYLMGYDTEDVNNGGNGYIPISLQYSDYCATSARAHSLAGGDPYEKFTDRSYRNKNARTINKCDMDLVQSTRKAIGNDKPLIVVINMANPMVMEEIEPYADAILIGFDVQNRAIIDIIAGYHEPSALLPFQLPADMDAVEEHCEDKPLDMRCYIDRDGNTYDFAYGLNWNGRIRDSRVKRYKSSL